MAKRRARNAGGELRRSCGAMAPTCCCWSRYRRFAPTSRGSKTPRRRRRESRDRIWRRSSSSPSRQSSTSSTSTNEQNISEAQINSQIKALNKDFRATNPDRNQTPAPGWASSPTRASSSSSSKVTRTKTSKTASARRRREGGGDRRHRAVHSEDASQHLGLRAHRRPARLRAVSRRPDRRPTAS